MVNSNITSVSRPSFIRQHETSNIPNMPGEKCSFLWTGVSLNSVWKWATEVFHCMKVNNITSIKTYHSSTLGNLQTKTAMGGQLLWRISRLDGIVSPCLLSFHWKWLWGCGSPCLDFFHFEVEENGGYFHRITDLKGKHSKHSYTMSFL